MVISHRYKYLYFVAPKCASTTVRNCLRDFTDIGSPATKYVQRGLRYPWHVPISHFLSSENAALFGAGYFRFSFVRNPYDRLYSAYLQERNDLKTTRSWRRWWAKRPIFVKIGDDFNRYITQYVRHADVHNDREWYLFCPMSAFTHLHGECAVDYVGRAENVDGSLAELSGHLGITIPEIENFNVRVEPTRTLKYLKYYHRETIEIVNEKYRDDFENFGYPVVDPSVQPRKAA